MKKPVLKPPGIGTVILKLLIRSRNYNVAIGDFIEIYLSILKESGKFKAWRWFWIQIFTSLPRFVNNSLYWSVIMFKNYLKVIFRNLVKHKTFSIINISGLGIGMASCIIILAFIYNELSYDSFHENKNRIYRLGLSGVIGGKELKIQYSNSAIPGILVNDFQEVEASARLKTSRRASVKYRNKQFYEDNILYADKSFFDIFTFPMVSGDPNTALEIANTVVITEKIAQKYFGDEDPVGKYLTFNKDEDFTVTGVVRTIPSNSHVNFDFLLSMETIIDENLSDIQRFMMFEYESYILLQEDFPYKELEIKFPEMVQSYMGVMLNASGSTMDFFLQPMKNIHLNIGEQVEGENGMQFIYVLTAISIFILIIAGINFMNLSTARSSVRLKEIGVRKVLGANKGKLIKQILGESLFFSLIALVLALILVELINPLIGELSGKDFQFNYAEVPWIIPGLIGLALIVGLSAGMYPALFLASFSPAIILKGNAGIYTGRSMLKKLLVVVQFAISTVLIIGTFVIYRQIEYMKKNDLGFDKEQIVILSLSDVPIRLSVNSIKEELKSFSDILSVTASSSVPGQSQPLIGIFPEGFSFNQPQIAEQIFIDHDFIPAMEIEILQGRNFFESSEADHDQTIIVNESAVKSYNWENPIGKTIQFFDMSSSTLSSKTVVGVIADIHTVSLHKKVEPLILENKIESARALSVRYREGKETEILNILRELWKRYDPDRPFDYFFLDESFDNQYKQVERLGQTFSYFSFIAIFIACLGLYAMASFTTKQRTKEIGIRKVLGASSSEVLMMFTKEFLKQIMVSVMVALPVAYVIMNRWLENFAYKTELNWLIFLSAGLTSLTIAFLTVAYQAFKAANANPVESLKYE